jgi:hypothetical protein
MRKSFLRHFLPCFWKEPILSSTVTDSNLQLKSCLGYAGRTTVSISDSFQNAVRSENDCSKKGAIAIDIQSNTTIAALLVLLYPTILCSFQGSCAHHDTHPSTSCPTSPPLCWWGACLCLFPIAKQVSKRY